jgi:hypothetical protein
MHDLDPIALLPVSGKKVAPFRKQISVPRTFRAARHSRRSNFTHSRHD